MKNKREEKIFLDNMDSKKGFRIIDKCTDF